MMYSRSTFPPENGLHESTGRAQGLIGLQCVFVCCMSWKTQITKVLVSERTMGTLFLVLGGFFGSHFSQVQGKLFLQLLCGNP